MQDMKVDLMYIVSKRILLNLNFVATFYGCDLTVSRLQSYCLETVYFLPQSSKDILVLI